MNSSLIHADIFFYITSVAVVVLTIMLIVLIYFIIRIAENLEYTSKKLREEGDKIIEDVSIIRESIEEQGSRAVSLFKFIFGSFMHPKEASKEAPKKKSRKK